MPPYLAWPDLVKTWLKETTWLVEMLVLRAQALQILQEQISELHSHAGNCIVTPSMPFYI